MSTPTPILRLSDSLTRRTAILRLSEGDLALPAGQLLEKYLLGLDNPTSLQQAAITPESSISLQALQDLVYACNDDGNLTSIYSGTIFRQREAMLELDERPIATEMKVDESVALLVDIEIDRLNVGYDRNWTGFHRRRWANSPDFFEGFVVEALEEKLGPAGASEALQLATPGRRLKFLDALGRTIWESQFENYSRFTGNRLMFKTGDETIRSIAAGAGGICTEKVQALKFLTDHYGFESEYLIGGDGARDPVPAAKLREMLHTFDFRFARRFMRYWQHAALLYEVDGVPILVDSTNGNIPYLFLRGEDVGALLNEQDKASVPVRMVEAEEHYYYHRVPQDIPQNLFFAMEGWLGDTDMVQVFENELGLFLSCDYYVTPLPYRSEQEYRRQYGEYQDIARSAGFRCHVSREWSLESELGQEFSRVYPGAADGILAAKEHLLLRYNGWDIPGHEAGLVIMRMV